MSAYDRGGLGHELKQETYYIEGKGWRTHHVISNTSSFEREATDEEIAEAKKHAPVEAGAENPARIPTAHSKAKAKK